MGTALQESGLLSLRQIHGPALGPFQLEPATHEDIWANYLAHNPGLSSLVTALSIPAAHVELENELMGNLWYAAAMCRVFYRRVPEALPAAGDLAGQAAYYKLHYNTPAGAATTDEYIANWRAAFPVGGAA